MPLAEEPLREGVPRVSAGQRGAESPAGPEAGAPRPEDTDPLLRRALEEDLGPGDVTSEVAVPARRRARGRLIVKEKGVICGLDLFARVFELLEPDVATSRLARDGERVRCAQVVMEVVGSARTLLAGERTALNLVQRLSGIATLAARFVDRIRGSAPQGVEVRILDTRKTTPGLRLLEKYAVRTGGAANHRFGLFDEAMVKNNHIDLAGVDPAELIRALRERHGEGLVIHAEARDEAEALSAIRGGADVVMLDNWTPDELRALCPRLRAAAAAQRRSVEIEASGGVTLEGVAEIASSGVDRISVGALTHSAPALDLSFSLEGSD